MPIGGFRQNSLGRVLALPASYVIIPAADNVNEGSTLSVTVNTENVDDGTVLYWTVSRPEDFTVSSGSFTVNNNTSTFNVGPTADSTTEGNETFTISIRVGSTSGEIVATSGSITINDTSLTPTYAVSPAANNVNEGSPLTINVTTTNVGNGTTLYWTLNRPADFAVSSGNFTINSNAGSFTVTPTADNTTEGPETFTVSIRTGSTSGTIRATTGNITINDTSQTPPQLDVLSAYSSTKNITIPAGASAGQIACIYMTTDQTFGNIPTGWTQLRNTSSNGVRTALQYRVLQAGDPGSTVTYDNPPTYINLTMIVYRRLDGTAPENSPGSISYFASVDAISSQTIFAAGEAAPLFGVAFYSSSGTIPSISGTATANMVSVGDFNNSTGRQRVRIFKAESGKTPESINDIGMGDGGANAIMTHIINM